MLIGRESELSALKEALGNHRLVTIWGPGGVGKSSLARELAATRRAAGAEVFSIGLRDVAPTVEGLIAALSRELELEAPKPALSAVARALESRSHALILVDEGETALAPLGRLLTDLLGRTASVRFLLTTRSLLGLAEEFPYELAPLAITAESDPESSPAGTLFLARARTLVPSFRIGEKALSLVLASTEGIPLAIELMAADCATLSEDIVLQRMPASLDATIERSWDRLPAADRESLLRLSAFSGAFSAAAAAAVLGASQASQLSSLRRQSLLLVDEAAGETPHFRLLTAVRAFARGRADANAWREAIRAHATYFAVVARGSGTDRGLIGELLAVSQRAVDDEALLPFAVDAIDALLDRLTVDISIVRSLVLDVLAAHPNSTFVPRLLAARALANEALGDLASAQADVSLAERMTNERGEVLDPYVSLARSTVAHGRSDTRAARAAIAPLLGKDHPARIRGRAFALLSAIEHVEGDLEAALAANESSLAFSREANDERAVYRSTLRLAFGLLDAGQPERALAELELFTTARTPLWQRALAATYRGNTLRRLGKFPEAREAHETAVSLFRQASSYRWESTALMDAGLTELVDHEYAVAIDLFRRALVLAEEVTDLHLQELICGYFAIATSFSGDVPRAMAIFERYANNAATVTAARSTEIHRAHLRYVEGTLARSELEGVMNPISTGTLRVPSPTEHIRWAIALANRAIELREPPTDALIIEDGRAHLPAYEAHEGAWVEISRKPTLERLLIALATAKTRVLSVSELVHIGWPDEKLQRAAAENRLRVALSSLRTLGNGALKSLLIHDKDGYRLRPTLRIIDHRRRDAI